MNNILKFSLYNDPVMNVIYNTQSRWITLKDPNVFLIFPPEGTSNFVLKYFKRFPHYELGGNLITTQMCGSSFFVSLLDAGYDDRRGEYFLVFPYFPCSLYRIQWNDREEVKEFLEQMNMALTQMENNQQLVHFDLRFDNIRLEMMDKFSPSLFRVGGKTYRFLIKIMDFGCCEFNSFLGPRDFNEEVIRSLKSTKTWGIFPRHYCCYDCLYFLFTLKSFLKDWEDTSLVQIILDELYDFVGRPVFTKETRPLAIPPISNKEMIGFCLQILQEMAKIDF